MRKIARTILCYSVAIVLLCFGMNFDEADALFHTLNARNEDVVMAVYSGGATILEVQSETVQIVGAKSESPVLQLVKQSSVGKKDVRMLLCILMAANIFENNSYFDRVICEVESKDIHYRIAVLNYIHDLDGKKRV